VDVTVGNGPSYKWSGRGGEFTFGLLELNQLERGDL
jgi:hypothetical protein